MDKLEVEKSFSDFAQSKVVAGHAFKISSSLLESLGNIELEAKESVAVATAQIWAKLTNGKLVVPEDLKNPDAFWMALFKSHIRNYLLKRYARRTNRKSNAVYEKELEDYKKELEKKDAPKPKRHQGGRFEGVDEKPLTDVWTEGPEDAALYTDDALRKQFLDLGFEPTVVDVILLRANGLTWVEVGHELGEKADTVRMRLARCLKKVELDSDMLF